MFKFDFDIDDADDQVVVPQVAAKATVAAPSVSRAPAQPCHSISLPELIKLLPASFSYSPLAHPLGGAPLLRRDLFDARFQLAQNGNESDDEDEDEAAKGKGKQAANDAEGEAYIDADTDLIPGTYEGGLKSWEGGLDLVEVMARNVGGESESESEGGEGEEAKIAAWVRGSRVLEVGCGTGLPSAYLLRALLSTPAENGKRTTLHVQDYNLPVLSLVTLPNLVLAALTSLPESARTAEAAPEDADREQDEAEAEAEDEFDDDADSEDAPPLPFDPTRAGNLDVSPALLDAFISILDDRGIDLRFTYGDWSGMAQQLAAEHEAAAEQQPYGLILTAETIYAEESVQGLLDVLRTASRQDKDESKVDKGMERETQKENLEDSLGALNVRDDWAKALGEGEPVILVAAKVLYFGVGGGLESFLSLVAAAGGWSSRVHDWVKGVGRAVVRVGW